MNSMKANKVWYKNVKYVFIAACIVCICFLFFNNKADEDKAEQTEVDSSSKEYIPNHVIPYCDFSDIEKSIKF